VADARPRPGRHKARHKAPSAFERTRMRVGDGMRSLPRPAAVAVVSGGLLAASAVAGSAVLGEDGGAAAVASASSSSSSSATSAESAPAAADARERERTEVSRDADRPSLADLKADALADEATGPGRHAGDTVVTHEALVTSDSDPRDIARALLAQHGWPESEFSCLDELYVGESNWQWNADNPTSSAYGIPQALPGEKMAAAGPDWRTNPATQIEWGLTYIAERYGSPCAANEFKNANNWY
jgi:hypothetical protein